MHCHFHSPGMDKILQPLPGEGASKETTVTNDGATILSRVWVDNPSAKILVSLHTCYYNYY